MSLLVAIVMGFVAGVVLTLAKLMGHPALFAFLLAILMGGFTAVMLRFAAVVPVVLTFLVFRLALPGAPGPGDVPGNGLAEVVRLSSRRSTAPELETSRSLRSEPFSFVASKDEFFDRP
jgi:hypothetical protein